MAKRFRRDGIEARARQVVMQVAGALALTPDGVLRAVSRKDGTGRRIAFYVLHSACGLSLAQTALAFGVDRSTVATACKAIEDRRDDPDFDQWLSALERSAAAAPMPAEPEAGSVAGGVR
jgi:chromosomal replication initiation ATPase DnaA